MFDMIQVSKDHLNSFTFKLFNLSKIKIFDICWTDKFWYHSIYKSHLRQVLGVKCNLCVTRIYVCLSNESLIFVINDWKTLYFLFLSFVFFQNLCYTFCSIDQCKLTPCRLIFLVCKQDFSFMIFHTWTAALTKSRRRACHWKCNS